MVLVDKGVKHNLHSDRVVRDRKILHNLLLTRRSVLEPSAFKADFLNYTFGQKGVNVIVLHVKQLVLDRRASAIDNKNNHSV